MKPSLGRVVIYTDHRLHEYAATITGVTKKPYWSDNPITDSAEDSYDVLLAVDMHRYAGPEFIGNRVYTSAPVLFDGRDSPAENTWHWPPRV